MDRSTHQGRRTLLAGAAGALISGISPLAWGQAAGRFPSRPVRVIVPFSPGGPVDAMARPLAQKLSERWGQPVIVENKAGGSATIGSDMVAKSAPDGYTLLMCNVGEIAILPSTMANMPYDSVRDFTPVTQLVSGPMVLAINPNLPFRNLQDLVNAAKLQPNKISYGSVGSGSISHVAGEMLNSLAKIQLLHAPYKGAGPVITDLLGGHINMAFVGISVASPLLANGKLRALAVSTTKRAGMLPDLPAISEQFPGFEVNSWYGVMAPAGTPRAIVQQIYEDISAVMKQPEFAEMIKSRGSDIEVSSPDQFALKIKDDLARFAAAAKTAGIDPKASN